MKCEATKVYLDLDKNVERERIRCEADATTTTTESPSVRKPGSSSHPPVDCDEKVYHLCTECAKAFDAAAAGEKGVYYDEKGAYVIIFD